MNYLDCGETSLPHMLDERQCYRLKVWGPSELRLTSSISTTGSPSRNDRERASVPGRLRSHERHDNGTLPEELPGRYTQVMDQADKGGPQTESNLDEPSRYVHSAGDLVQRLLDHDSAFRGFLRRRIGDEALVEDLLQHSFVKAVERQHSLRNDDSIVAWFYRVLRNTVIDYYRSHGAESKRDEAFLQELTHLGEDKEPPLDEMKAAVCQCLYGIMPELRSTYRELLRRIDLEGESPAHVANDLNITLNNLTVRLHRARQALREGLEQSCGVCSQHGCLNCSCD